MQTTGGKLPLTAATTSNRNDYLNRSYYVAIWEPQVNLLCRAHGDYCETEHLIGATASGEVVVV